MPQIVTGKVSLEQGTNGTRLVITTPASVSEPALRLAVQTGCGSTTRRDYVLLLDPPNSESPTMVAAADADEAPWTRVHAQEHRGRLGDAAAERRRRLAHCRARRGARQFRLAQPVAEARPKAAEKDRPRVQAPRLRRRGARPHRANSTTVSSSSGVGGFISEAAAASPCRRATATPRATSQQSLPLTAQPVWRAQPQPPPGASGSRCGRTPLAIFCTIALALVAFVAHRRHTVSTSWMDPKARTSTRGRDASRRRNRSRSRISAI